MNEIRTPPGVSFARDELTGAEFVINGKGATSGDLWRVWAVQQAAVAGIDVTASLVDTIEARANQIDADEDIAIRTRGVPASGRKLLGATTKKEATRIATTMSLTKDEFCDLMWNARQLRFTHTSWHYEHVPPERALDVRDHCVTKSSAPDAVARVKRKRVQLLAERLHRSVHLLEDERGSWHVFYLTFRDVAGDMLTGKHHWGEGPHIHYISHFGSSKSYVLDQLALTHTAVRGVHIRYVDPDMPNGGTPVTEGPRAFVLRQVSALPFRSPAGSRPR